MHHPGIFYIKNQKAVIRVLRITKNVHTRYEKEIPCAIFREIDYQSFYWQQNFDTVWSLTDAPPPLEFSREKRGQPRKQPKMQYIELICKCLHRYVGMTDISYCLSCDTARYISHQYWPGSTALARMFTSACNYYVTCNRIYIFLNYFR